MKARIVFGIVALVAGFAFFVFGYRLANSYLQAKPAFEQTKVSASQCSLENPGLLNAAGHPFVPADYAGKTVLINFWASWCSHCREEIPVLEEIASRYSDYGVKVIGVAVDNPKRAQKFAQEHHITYPVLYGHQAATMLLRGCSPQSVGLPVTVVLDASQRICAKHTGALSEQDAKALLQQCKS